MRPLSVEWVNILTNMIETAEAGAVEVPMETEDVASGEDRPPELLNLDKQKTTKGWELNQILAFMSRKLSNLKHLLELVFRSIPCTICY